jgi:ABC-type nitrate/sulfonate/bicarbonate transport system substrate-binding protein
MNWRPLKAGLLAAAALVAAAVTAGAQDVPTIRLGRQTAAEENLWLMLAKPQLAPNLGKAYKLDWSQWRASDMAFKAYEANEIDMATTSANAVIVAASKGLDFKIIASISLESSRGPQTSFLAKADGGPATIADLKGQTIGIIGYRTSIELWAREGIKTGGLNPDRDVKWAVLPFGAMVEAIRTGKIATAGVPEMFAKGEMAKGGLKVLFTSKTGVPFDEELIALIANPAFLKKHPAAVRAFLADLVHVTKIYMADTKAGRQAIVDAKLVQLPPEVYLNLTDYVRDPGLRPSVEILTKMQDNLVASRFQEKKIDIKTLVDLSYLPAN